MFGHLSLQVDEEPAISWDRSDMLIFLVMRFFFMVFSRCVSRNRRNTKRIQVFGFYRFMEAVKDRGREAAYCDKPVNRLARSRSGFSWQRTIRRYAPLHYTVQFVTCHLTCAVRVRLTSVLDLISVFGGYIHRMRVGYFYCLSPRVYTQVGVANNLSICLCLLCILLSYQFPSF